jgi:hypothetical protein
LAPDADRGAILAGVQKSSDLARLGAVGFASQIPVFLLAPIAVWWRDRVNRHWIVTDPGGVDDLGAFLRS